MVVVVRVCGVAGKEARDGGLARSFVAVSFSRVHGLADGNFWCSNALTLHLVSSAPRCWEQGALCRGAACTQYTVDGPERNGRVQRTRLSNAAGGGKIQTAQQRLMRVKGCAGAARGRR
tara:strand:- start:15680 stop:16036 length:357 start_codon:yes stop_codon:yes gene_type:complete